MFKQSSKRTIVILALSSFVLLAFGLTILGQSRLEPTTAPRGRPSTAVWVAEADPESQRLLLQAGDRTNVYLSRDEITSGKPAFSKVELVRLIRLEGRGYYDVYNPDTRQHWFVAAGSEMALQSADAK